MCLLLSTDLLLYVVIVVVYQLNIWPLSCTVWYIILFYSRHQSRQPNRLCEATYFYLSHMCCYMGACNKFFWAASCWSRLSFALPWKGIYSCWVIDPLKAWPFLVNVRNSAAMQDKQVNRFWDSFLGVSNVWNTSLGLLEILFLSMPELEFKAKTWTEVHENVLKTYFLTWYVVPFYSTACIFSFYYTI